MASNLIKQQMKLKQLSFESAIDFSNQIVEEQLNNAEALYDFFDGFGEIYRREKKRLPYHINIIDELRANENAHSRILGMLLQHKEQDGLGYEILRSFIDYIVQKYKEKKAFREIDIASPAITVEKRRIDLWIREKGKYAIIIENKIYNAVDQTDGSVVEGGQLERYINTTKEYGYSEEDIYVLYLPPTYEKEPEPETWGKYHNKDIHKNRYLKLSFRDDILPWLKNAVLPNVRIKERFLMSSLEQYIDHLEGKFSLRTINNNMNMELQKFIKNKLEITNAKPQEALLRVIEKKEEVENALNQLKQLEGAIKLDHFEIWEKKLAVDFPSLSSKIISEWAISNAYNYLGVKIERDESAFSVIIGYDTNHIYYGISTLFATEVKDMRLNFEKIVMDFDFKVDDRWYGSAYCSFEDAYSSLKSLINRVIA